MSSKRPWHKNANTETNIKKAIADKDAEIEATFMEQETWMIHVGMHN